MAAKFEIFRDQGNRFRFRLKSGNNEIIAVSEAYSTKAGAQNGIQAIKRDAPAAPVSDLT